MSRLPSALTLSQSSVLGGIGVRPLTETEKVRINQPMRRHYETLHPLAIQNRDNLAKLNELADPSELTRLITQAENFAKTPEGISTAVTILHRCQRIFDAQNAQAVQRGVEKRAYEMELTYAKQALTTLKKVPNADPLPLEDLIIAATGLAERGQYAAAKVRVYGYLEVVKVQNTQALKEPGKRDEYRAQLAIAEQALGFLRLDQYREFVDPSELERRIETAKVHQDEGRYASALDALGDHKKLGDGLLLTARDIEAKKGEYTRRAAVCKTMISSVTAPDRTGIVFADATELLVLAQTAEGLANEKKYADAVKALATVETVGEEIRKKATENKAKQTEYQTKRRTAETQLTELKRTAPLTDPAPLHRRIDEAEIWAGKHQFVAALKSLGDTAALLSREQGKAEARRPAFEKYQREIANAERLLIPLAANPLATTTPLEQIILLARSAAEGGNYVLATNTLRDAAKIAGEQTRLAAAEKKSESKYTTLLAIAQGAVTRLVEFGELADPTKLQSKITTAQGLANFRKYASALQAMEGWDTENDKQYSLGSARRRAKAQYDGKLERAKNELAKIRAVAQHKNMADDVAIAESLAQASKYDEAVAKLDVAIEFAFNQLALQKENARHASRYELTLRGTKILVDSLIERGREDLLGDTQKCVDIDAPKEAEQGNYPSGIRLLDDANRILIPANLSAALDVEKQPVYILELNVAKGEITRLLSSDLPTSPQRLQQMVSQAEAIANNKRFAAALETLKSHTTVFNELMRLASSEAGKKDGRGGYPKCLENAEEALMNLRQKPSVSAEGIKEAEDLIAEAKTQAKATKFASACATLVEFTSLCTRVSSEADQTVQLEAANQQYGPLYRQRHETCLTLLNELSTLPGTEGAAGDLRNKLRTAEIEAKKNNLKAAAAALDGAPEMARKAITASAKAVEDIGKTSGIIIKDYGNIKKLNKKQISDLESASGDFQTARDQAETALETLRQVAHPDEIATAAQRVTDACALAVTAREQTNLTAGLAKITAATEKLNTFALELTNRQGLLDAAKRNSTNNADAIKAMLRDLWLITRAEEIGSFDERFKRAQNLITARQFEAADKILDALKPRLTIKSTDIKKDMALWTTENLKLTNLAGSLNGYAGVPALTDGIQSIRDQIDVLRTMRVGQEKDYRRAAEEAGDVLAQTDLFDKVKRQFTEFEARRDEADDEVKEADRMVGVELDALKIAMTREAGGECFPADLTARRAAVLTAWNKRLIAAFNETTLGADDAIAELRKLATEAKESAQDPRAAVEADTQKQAREAFEAARDDTRRELMALRSKVGNEAVTYEDEYQNVLDRAESDLVRAKTEVSMLRARVWEAVRTGEDARNAAAVKARTRAATATAEIDSLQKGLKTVFTLSKERANGFAAYFAAAKTQITELDGMRNSGNLLTIAAAEQELVAIMNRVRVAAADASNETPGERNFEAVGRRCKELRTEFDGKKDVKKCLPTDHARVDKEFTALANKINAMEPGAALDALFAFRDSLEPIYSAAKKASTDRTTIKEATDKAKSDLARIEENAPTYYATLLKQVKKAAADGKKEKGETSALARLTTLQAEIDRAIDPARTTPVDLAGKEKTCRENNAALKNAVANWEATLKVFETQSLKAAKAAVAGHPEGDKSQIDGLKSLRDKAKEAAKLGDYAGAVKQLQTATKVAQRAIEAPQGLRHSSRDNLRGVEARWRTAVQQVNAGITAVSNKLQELGQTEEIGNLGPITRSLDELVTGALAFNADVFAVAIATLSKKNNALAERRAAREAGMRFVRQYQDRLKDPILRVLFTKNPFGTVPLNLINAALDDLDLNIQRCV